MYQVHGPGGWAQFTSIELHVSEESPVSGRATICMEKTTTGRTVNRGLYSITSYGTDSIYDIGGQMGWRPVLEVV